MTDLEDRLRQLSVEGAGETPPVERVQRRASQLRRRRRLAEAAAATSLAVVAVFVAVSLPRLTTPETGVVFEQPPAPLPEGWTRTSIGALTLDHPQEWTVQRAVREDPRDPRLVLSNRDLSGQDIDRALLARDDVRFSDRFPADAVVFVVGGDRLVAPPAPDDALGDPRTLPRPRGFGGDISVRTGRIGGSIYHLAAYIGPDAARDAADAVGEVAQRVRLRREPVEPGSPPPPPGSGPVGALAARGIEPDNPIFTMPWPVQAQIALDDDEVINVRTKDDCVAVTLENTVATRNLSVLSEQCGVGPATQPIQVAASGLVMGGTIAGDLDDAAEQQLIVARLGAEVRDVKAQRIGVEKVQTVMENGWVIALSEGRILRLVALDGEGRRLGSIED